MRLVQQRRVNIMAPRYGLIVMINFILNNLYNLDSKGVKELVFDLLPDKGAYSIWLLLYDSIFPYYSYPAVDQRLKQAC